MIIRRSANFRLANSSKYLDFGLVRRKRDHRKKKFSNISNFFLNDFRMISNDFWAILLGFSGFKKLF